MFNFYNIKSLNLKIQQTKGSIKICKFFEMQPYDYLLK